MITSGNKSSKQYRKWILGKEDAEDNVMRVINPEAAEELLESALK